MDQSTVDLTDSFKQGMRRLTSTVALITTSQDATPFGMAVTAVCSVGLTPPSLMISVAKTASMHGPVLARGAFCVNLLTDDHADLVGAFSGKVKGPERFDLGAWDHAAHGLPVLKDAQVSFICVNAKTLEHAGHTLIIGEVTAVTVKDDISPLLYQNGNLALAQVLQ